MLNNVALVGRLTKDVELKQTQNGKSVASFTLAVNRNFKNAQGETEADFINCVIWGKSAEALAQYTSKGTMIGVDGSIQTRTYDDKDGKRVYVTEVNVNNFHFLEKRQDNQQSGYGQQGGYQQQNAYQPQGGYQQPIPEAQQVDFGDKLPF